MAFVQLRFPEAIKALSTEKDEEVVRRESEFHLQELSNFFLNQMEYEDAMEFIENTLHHLQSKKWGEDEPQFAGDMSKQMKLIKFKPTHEAFRKLQESYVDARAHLGAQIVEGQKRLESIEEDLRKEQAAFDQMCN